MTKPVRMEIDAKTGKVQMIELTDEEIAQMKKFAEEAEAQEAAKTEASQ